MLLSGYHGANEEKALRIQREGKYPLSHGPKEWLGKGIYFYYFISDACKWRDTAYIFHSIIKVKDTEFIDFDTQGGKDLIANLINYILENFYSERIFYKGSAFTQKNQCSIMNIIWDIYPKIMVMSCSFPIRPRPIPILTDYIPKRKEFCVRDNSLIKHTCVVKKEDLDEHD